MNLVQMMEEDSLHNVALLSFIVLYIMKWTIRHIDLLQALTLIIGITVILITRKVHIVSSYPCLLVLHAVVFLESNWMALSLKFVFML